MSGGDLQLITKKLCAQRSIKDTYCTVQCNVMQGSAGLDLREDCHVKYARSFNLYVTTVVLNTADMDCSYHDIDNTSISLASPIFSCVSLDLSNNKIRMYPPSVPH
jgi:hypothetical protein